MAKIWRLKTKLMTTMKRRAGMMPVAVGVVAVVGCAVEAVVAGVVVG